MATKVLVRMPEALKQALEAAAEKRGVSATAEIVARLEASIELDSDAGRLGQALGTVMGAAGDRAAALAGRSRWLADPWSYDQATAAAVRILEALRPRGEAALPTVRPDPEIIDKIGAEAAMLYAEEKVKRTGVDTALYMLAAIRGHLDARARKLQTSLGPLVARLSQTGEKK